MEWVEVTGSTVDVAVEAAIAELGIESVDQAEVEVIQEGKAGFLGVGSRPAIVKVSRKPRKRNRRSRRGSVNRIKLKIIISNSVILGNRKALLQ